MVGEGRGEGVGAHSTLGTQHLRMLVPSPCPLYLETVVFRRCWATEAVVRLSLEFELVGEQGALPPKPQR